MSDEFYCDLPCGTFLRCARTGHRIRLIEDMDREWAYCEWVKGDGTRDLRMHGWSGSLLKSAWHLEPSS